MAAAKQQPAQPKGGKGKSNDQMPRSIVQQEVTPGYTSTGIDTTAQQYNPTSYQPGTGWAPTVGGANGRPVPNIPQENPDKPNLTILGAAGTSFFGGLIQNTGEYNPTLHWRDWVTKVDEMLRSDAQLRALQELLTNTLLAAKWSIVPANDDPVNVEIASFVETCLLKDIRYTTDAGIEVRQDFKQILRHILLMVPYGFSPLEVAWRQEDDGEGGYWLKLAKLQPLLPSTVYRWWVGRDVELEGIQTWAWKDYAWRFTNIPASKLLLFTHDMQGQNYEGLSALRPAFQAWYYKQQFLKIAAIAVERNGVEIPVINLGANATPADANAALRLGQNMRANSQPAAVLPNDWKIEYPRLSQNHAATILPWVQYFDVLMGRAYHAPWVNLGSTEVGAYNLDASQKRMTLMAWQAIPDTEICPVLQPLIEQIVRLNFGEQDLYPRLECGKLIATDVTVLADSLQALGMYLQPGPEINDWVADAMGVPKPAQNAVEATNPSGPDDGGSDGGAGSDGGDQGNDGTQDEGDSSSDGGGDSSGSAGMSEAALLSEAIAAVYGLDAIERGEVWLGGHEPGYTQNRDKGGKFAPGNGPSHPAGSGRGRGHGKGEEETTGGSGRGGGGGGSGSGGKGRAARSAKSITYEEFKAKIAEIKARFHATGRDGEDRMIALRALRGSYPRHAAREGREIMAANAKANEEAGRAKVSAEHRAVDEARSGTARRGGAAGKGAEGEAKAAGARATLEKLNPYHLQQDVRPEQLRPMLERTTANRLRSAVAEVQSRNPGTKPAGNTNAARVDYIMHHVAGEHNAYSESLAKAATRAPKAPAESIHERAARLQREGGLKPEVQPGEPTPVERAIATIDTYSPYGNQSARTIAAGYGEHAVGAILSRAPMTVLRGMAEKDQLPGPVPRGKAALVSALTSHVTEGRYSANFGGEKGTGTTAKEAKPATERAPRGSTRTSATIEDKYQPAKSTEPRVELKPTGHVDLTKLRTDGIKDVRALYNGYGSRQSLRVLRGLTITSLRPIAEEVQSRHPGTAPISKTSRAALTKYIHETTTAELGLQP